MNRVLVLLPLLALLASCEVGPDYVRPDPSSMPAAFKELRGWKAASPADLVDRGAWWSIYRDPLLNDLAARVEVDNQSLRANEAAYRQAVAVVAEARAQLFPTIGATGSDTRRRGTTGGSTVLSSSSLTGTGTGLGSTAATTNGAGTTTATNSGGSTSGSFGGGAAGRAVTTYTLEGTFSWEPDLWGRVRRQVESEVAAAQASAADVANARLSLQSTLVTDYMLLRAADELKALLDRTAGDYGRAVTIAQNQYNAGIAARGDLVAAQTQLAGAVAASINVGVQRSQLEHAIAVLIGRAPSEVSIPPGTLPTFAPVVPAGVPSALLERRPDIAAAERAMEQQNANVGVAVAAFYPTVTLSALGGLSGDPLPALFNIANNIWSLGGSVAGTLFDGGARSATLRGARATYDQSVATYRQTVLTAFQQVEDALSGLRVLQEQSAAEAQAVALARRSVQIALNQYRAGTQPYTAVITAQNTALADEQAALTVQQNLLTSSVSLVVALGGGWDVGEIPGPKALRNQPIFP